MAIGWRPNEDAPQGVAAYEAALGERTRERVPLDWARTQNNLGWALGFLGERFKPTEMLSRGKNAVQSAWESARLLHKTATTISRSALPLSMLRWQR